MDATRSFIFAMYTREKIKINQTLTQFLYFYLEKFKKLIL